MITMNHNNPLKSYHRISMETASPGKLVLMLFDGAIRFLEAALTGFSMEDPLEFNQTIHNNILRAQDIINELNFSLNMEAGKELPATLRDLYSYMNQRLQESNLQKQSPGIEEVLERLNTLRNAWAEMIEGAPVDIEEPEKSIIAEG